MGLPTFGVMGLNPNRSLEKLSNFLLEKSSTNGTNVSSENRFHQ